MLVSTIDLKIYESTKRIMGTSFPRVIQCFLGVAPDYIAEIRQGILEHDLHKVKSGAHTLKSSSIQVGAALLSEKARAIELKACEKNVLFSDIEKFLEFSFGDLLNAFDKTKAELENMN